MAKSTGIGSRYGIGGYDVSGDINALNRIGGGPATIDMTDITQAGMDRSAGLFDAGMEAAAYFDPAAGASHEHFATLPTSSQVAMWASASAAGAAVACMIGKEIDYPANRGQDGAFMLAPNVQESDGFPLEWGVTLTTWGLSLSGAGNVASVDLGSASPGAFGAVFYAQVFTFTGTSITLKIQESSDNAVGDAFADVVGGGFSAISAAHGGQRVMTGAINVERYLRVVASGTFSAATLVVAAIRHRIARAYS